MVEHLNDFKGLDNQLFSMRLALDDELLVLLFHCLSLESWGGGTLVVSPSSFAPRDKLTMDVMKSKLRRS